jgi:hypothetical protein
MTTAQVIQRRAERAMLWAELKHLAEQANPTTR